MSAFRRFALLAIVVAVLPATASAADSIYWGAEGAGAIQAGNLDGSGSASTVFGGEGGPCGLAIDPAAGKIYWANFNSNNVRVANLDGSGTAATLFSEGGRLCGVAIDPAAGKIYWADFDNDLIRVGNLDGTGASTLYTETDGSAPSGVAIDPAAGKIYWTNQFSDEVRVGNLDGTGVASTLFGGEDNPIGVAIAAGKLYWTDLNSGKVRVGNLDGSGATDLFSGETQPGGVAVDPGAGKIYWATFGPSTIRVGNLDGTGLAANLFASGSLPLFAALLRAPVGTGDPVITSGAGGELTCSQGSWAADLLGAFLFRAPNSFSYKWLLDGNEIPGENLSTFTPTSPGSYTCEVTASNHAGSASQTSAPFSTATTATLSVTKFYDANANGIDDDSQPITGWKVKVSSGVPAYALVGLTPLTAPDLAPNTYTVREFSPKQKAKWLATTPSAVQITLAAGDSGSVEFGNVCVGIGGGLSHGFWSNKHGQALFGADDLALMVSLNLRNANGTNFDPSSYSAFRTWLRNATARNMAYMLSAQLAAMELNVLNGKVSGDALINAPGTTSANAVGFATVNAVMGEANSELGLHGLTNTSGATRRYQETLKDALDRANNNKSFAQATPCAFSF
jgi:DNA-binding beta-propeller fold protein YncE